MIVCANCDSAQWLQITESRVFFEGGELTELEEKYECTLCEATGEYDHTGDLSGDVKLCEDRPRYA